MSRIAAQLLEADAPARCTSVSATACIQDEARQTAISADPAKVLEALLETGMLMRTLGDDVVFTYPAFTDYFYSRHILFHSSNSSTKDLVARFQRTGGALAFVAAERQADDLVLQCFESISHAAGSARLERELDMEAVAAVESVPHSVTTRVAQSFDSSTSPEHDQLESAIETHTTPIPGRDPRISDSTAAPSLFSSFISAVSVLRAGTRLSSASKRLCVDEAVTCCVTVVNRLLRNGGSFLEQAFSSPSPDFALTEDSSRLARGVILAILAQVGNLILATAGSDRHLSLTIRQEFDEEASHGRRFVLLTWQSAVNPDDIVSMTNSFIASSPNYAILCLAQHWFLLNYIFESTVDRVPSGTAKRCLEAVSAEMLRVQTKNGGTDFINRSVGNYMQRVEIAKRGAAGASR